MKARKVRTCSACNRSDVEFYGGGSKTGCCRRCWPEFQRQRYIAKRPATMKPYKARKRTERATPAALMLSRLTEGWGMR